MFGRILQTPQALLKCKPWREQHQPGHIQHTSKIIIYFTFPKFAVKLSRKHYIKNWNKGIQTRPFRKSFILPPSPICYPRLFDVSVSLVDELTIFKS
ncbi:hypothetical protein Mapa_016114 [Marchantia paleacea]|nr:hypothetical protein Mapa_016114 [Marchantia paleacea]